jgi:hypothetical protein
MLQSLWVHGPVIAGASPGFVSAEKGQKKEERVQDAYSDVVIAPILPSDE